MMRASQSKWKGGLVLLLGLVTLAIMAAWSATALTESAVHTLNLTSCDQPNRCNFTDMQNASLMLQANTSVKALWTFEGQSLNNLAQNGPDLRQLGSGSATRTEKYLNVTVNDTGSPQGGTATCYNFTTVSNNANFLNFSYNSTWNFTDDGKQSYAVGLNLSGGPEITTPGTDHSRMTIIDADNVNYGFTLDMNNETNGGDFSVISGNGSSQEEDQDNTDWSLLRDTYIAMGADQVEGLALDLVFNNRTTGYAGASDHKGMTLGSPTIQVQVGRRINGIYHANFCLNYLMIADTNLGNETLQWCAGSKHCGPFEQTGNISMNFTFTTNHTRANLTFDCLEDDAQTSCCALISGGNGTCVPPNTTDMVLSPAVNRTVTILLNTTNVTKTPILYGPINLTVTGTDYEAPDSGPQTYVLNSSMCGWPNRCNFTDEQGKFLMLQANTSVKLLYTFEDGSYNNLAQDAPDLLNGTTRNATFENVSINGTGLADSLATCYRGSANVSRADTNWLQFHFNTSWNFTRDPTVYSGVLTSVAVGLNYSARALNTSSHTGTGYLLDFLNTTHGLTLAIENETLGGNLFLSTANGSGTSNIDDGQNWTAFDDQSLALAITTGSSAVYVNRTQGYAVDLGVPGVVAPQPGTGYLFRVLTVPTRTSAACLNFVMVADSNFSNASLADCAGSKHCGPFERTGNMSVNFTYQYPNALANISFACKDNDTQATCCALISGNATCFGSGSLNINLSNATNRTVTLVLNTTNVSKTPIAFGEINLSVARYDPVAGGDTTAPQVRNLTNTTNNYSVNLTFDWTEPANVTVQWGLTNASMPFSLNWSLVTNVTFFSNISNLTNNTNYYINISGCDATVNCNTTTLNISTAQTDDVDAPQVRNLTNTTNNYSVNLSFNTDEPANISVVWGLSNASMPTRTNWSYVTNGTFFSNISGLANHTNYYFNVTTCDGDGPSSNCNTTTFNLSTEPSTDALTQTHTVSTTSCDQPNRCNFTDMQGALLMLQANTSVKALWTFENQSLNNLAQNAPDLLFNATYGAPTYERVGINDTGSPTTNTSDCYRFSHNGSHGNALAWTWNTTWNFTGDDNAYAVSVNYSAPTSRIDTVDAAILLDFYNANYGLNLAFYNATSNNGGFRVVSGNGAANAVDTDSVNHTKYNDTHVALGFSVDISDGTDAAYVNRSGIYATEASHAALVTGAPGTGYVGRADGLIGDNETGSSEACLNYVMLADTDLDSFLVDCAGSKHCGPFEQTGNLTINFTFTTNHTQANLTFDCLEDDAQTSCCALISGGNGTCVPPNTTDMILANDTNRTVTLVLNTTNVSKTPILYGLINLSVATYDPVGGNTTCTVPTTGDWNLNCADSCTLTDQIINLGTGRLLLYGTGNVTFSNTNVTFRGYAPNPGSPGPSCWVVWRRSSTRYRVP